LNGTVRERLASLTRNSRHAASRRQALHTGMDLLDCMHNFCVVYQERSKEKQWDTRCTPAMASRRTDPVWGFGELLWYHGAPAPWVPPQRRGRPPKQTEPHTAHEQKRSHPLIRS
jgi:hypothetical protein